VVGEITLEQDLDEIHGPAEPAGAETSSEAIHDTSALEPEDDDASEGEGDEEDDEE
jgi:hypothetical protein